MAQTPLASAVLRARRLDSALHLLLLLRVFLLQLLSLLLVLLLEPLLAGFVRILVRRTLVLLVLLLLELLPLLILLRNHLVMLLLELLIPGGIAGVRREWLTSWQVLGMHDIFRVRRSIFRARRFPAIRHSRFLGGFASVIQGFRSGCPRRVAMIR